LVVKRAFIIGAALGAGALVFACAQGSVDDTSGDQGGGSDEAGSGNDDGGGTVDPGTDGGTSSGGDSGSMTVDSGPACIADASCMTTNPGACAPGAIQCGDGGAVCVPHVTTQSCYSGEAGAPGTGVCKSGTQSCIGTIGACTGDVVATTVENCFNNLDDNCDGKINEGCPASVVVGTPRNLGGAGGSGGSPKTVMCPAGAFVTRVDSWFDDHDAKASGVSITCATPSLVQGATAYSVTLVANAPAPYAVEHGSQSPAIERTDDCGLGGLVAITYSVGLSDTYVEAQGHHCSSSTVTLDATNNITFKFTNAGSTDFNAYAGSPGTFFQLDCNTGQNPQNQVVVGFNLRDGSYLDNLAPICAPLTVKLGAGTPDP